MGKNTGCGQCTILLRASEMKFGDSEMRFGESAMGFGESEMGFEDSEMGFEDSEMRVEDSEMRVEDSAVGFGDSAMRFEDSAMGFYAVIGRREHYFAGEATVIVPQLWGRRNFTHQKILSCTLNKNQQQYGQMEC